MCLIIFLLVAYIEVSAFSELFNSGIELIRMVGKGRDQAQIGRLYTGALRG